MKKFLVLFAALVLVGAGCAKPVPVDPGPGFVGTAYENREFGFAFDYPDYVGVNVRKDDARAFTYNGIPVDFFLSIRDVVRESVPENLAYVYAAQGLSQDAFVQSITDTDPNASVTSIQPVTFGDLEMVEIVNTTDIGDPKTHYLFDVNGTTIIISVFLGEEENIAPIMKTFRHFE